MNIGQSPGIQISNVARLGVKDILAPEDGVKEFTQEMTRRIAEAGYVGIAPKAKSEAK
jgi:hypothetical protein